MTIKLIIIMLLAADIFLIFIGRNLILRLARKLDEVVEELEKNFNRRFK